MPVLPQKSQTSNAGPARSLLPLPFATPPSIETSYRGSVSSPSTNLSLVFPPRLGYNSTLDLKLVHQHHPSSTTLSSPRYCAQQLYLMASLQLTPRNTSVASSRSCAVTFPTTLPDFEGNLSLQLEGQWVDRWCTISEGRLHLYATRLAAASRPFTPQRAIDLSIYDSIETSHSWGVDATGHFEIRLASATSHKDIPAVDQSQGFPRRATSGALYQQGRPASGSPVKSFLSSSKPPRKPRPALTPVQPSSPSMVIPKGCLSADGLLTVVPKVSTWSRLTGRGRRSLRLINADSSDSSGHDLDASALNSVQQPQKRRPSLALRADNANEMLRWIAVISPLLVEARVPSLRSFSLSPSASLAPLDKEFSASSMPSPQGSIVGTLMEEAGYNARRRRTASAEVASRRTLSRSISSSIVSDNVMAPCNPATRPKRRLSRISSETASSFDLTVKSMESVGAASKGLRSVSGGVGPLTHFQGSNIKAPISLTTRGDLSTDFDCATPTNTSVALWQKDCSTDLLDPVLQQTSQDVDIIPAWRGSPMMWERRRSTSERPSFSSRGVSSPTAAGTESSTSTSMAKVGLGLSVASQKALAGALSGESVGRRRGEGSASMSPDTPAASSLMSATSTRSGSDYFSSVVSSAPTSPLTPSVFVQSEAQQSAGSVIHKRMPAVQIYNPDPTDSSQYDWLTSNRTDHMATLVAQPGCFKMSVARASDPAATSIHAHWADPTSVMKHVAAQKKDGQCAPTTEAASPFSRPCIISQKLLEPIEMISKLDEISRLDPSAAAQARQALYNSKTGKGGLRRPAMPPRAWTTSATHKFQTASVQANELPKGLASPFIPRESVPAARQTTSQSSSLKLPAAGGPFDSGYQPIDFFQLKTTAGAPTRPSRRRVVTTNGALLPFTSRTHSVISESACRASVPTAPTTSNEDKSCHPTRSPLRARNTFNTSGRLEEKMANFFATPDASTVDRCPRTPTRSHKKENTAAFSPPLKSFFNDEDTDDDCVGASDDAEIEDEDARYVEQSYLASRGLLPTTTSADNTFGCDPFSR